MKSVITFILLFSSLEAYEERVQIALASIHMSQDFIRKAQDNSHDYQVVEDSAFSALIFLKNAESPP